MSGLEKYLPVTVIAAIILFIVREVVEAVRRHSANARTKKAFLLMLQRECELNHWVYTCLFRIATEMQANVNNGRTCQYSVSRNFDQGIAFRRETENGWSQTAIPITKTAVMERLMLETASLDKTLFQFLGRAYDSIIEMEHVRQSLYDLIDTEDEHRSAHLETFPGYALRELAGSLAALNALYKECTGNELKVWRVR